MATVAEGNVDCDIDALYLVSSQVSSHSQISFLFALKVPATNIRSMFVNII